MEVPGQLRCLFAVGVRSTNESCRGCSASASRIRTEGSSDEIRVSQWPRSDVVSSHAEHGGSRGVASVCSASAVESSNEMVSRLLRVSAQESKLEIGECLFAVGVESAD
jgi:hypothetical protein